MRFLHTSDWHLGMMVKGGVSYRADQEFAIHNICEIARREKVDGILLAGDVFDKSIAASDAIQVYDNVMTHICMDLGIPVYIIAGNHDGAERLSSCNRLLDRSGLHIAGSLNAKPQVYANGDVDIYLLPWISTDKVKSVFPDEASNIESLEDAYRIVLDHYRASFVEGHKNILVAHAFITDAETSVSDKAAEVGKATMIGASVFEGFDYVALGHLHGPQQINEKIRYSGTPMAYSFGKEEKQEKSVSIVDLDKRDIKIVPIPQLHKRVTLSGTFDELMRGEFEEDILKGYVRLDVTDSFVGLDSMAYFREKFSNLLEINCKSFERDDARITMTIEELESSEKNPEEIFSRYCEDILEEAPSEHILSLFREAVADYEREVSEA